MEEQALLQAIERIVHTEVSDSEARLNKRIDKLDDRMGRMENRMDCMETRMVSMEKRMDSTETRMEGIEGKLNAVQVELQKLQTKVDNGFHTIAAIIRDEVPAYPAKKYKKI